MIITDKPFFQKNKLCMTEVIFNGLAFIVKLGTVKIIISANNLPLKLTFKLLAEIDGSPLKL